MAGGPIPGHPRERGRDDGDLALAQLQREWFFERRRVTFNTTSTNLMNTPIYLLDGHAPQPIPPVDDDEDDDNKERKPGSGGGNIDPDDDDEDDEDDDGDDGEDTLWTLGKRLESNTSSGVMRQRRARRKADMLQSPLAAICE